MGIRHKRRSRRVPLLQKGADTLPSPRARQRERCIPGHCPNAHSIFGRAFLYGIPNYLIERQVQVIRLTALKSIPILALSDNPHRPSHSGLIKYPQFHKTKASIANAMAFPLDSSQNRIYFPLPPREFHAKRVNSTRVSAVAVSCRVPPLRSQYIQTGGEWMGAPSSQLPLTRPAWTV